jgi:hypothetical protein
MKHYILALVLIAIPLAAGAQSVQLQRPVPYSEDGDIADNIKQECRINEQLADFVQQSAKAQGVEVQFTPGPADKTAGRVLDLRITNAISMGNAWLGHQKATSVTGTLYENGVRIAGFKARRHSMGGAFAGYKGSCSVLGRTVQAIGEDIGGWLKSPVDGASLGD